MTNVAKREGIVRFLHIRYLPRIQYAARHLSKCIRRPSQFPSLTQFVSLQRMSPLSATAFWTTNVGKSQSKVLPSARQEGRWTEKLRMRCVVVYVQSCRPSAGLRLFSFPPHHHQQCRRRKYIVSEHIPPVNIPSITSSSLLSRQSIPVHQDFFGQLLSAHCSNFLPLTHPPCLHPHQIPAPDLSVPASALVKLVLHPAFSVCWEYSLANQDVDSNTDMISTTGAGGAQAQGAASASPHGPHHFRPLGAFPHGVDSAAGRLPAPDFWGWVRRYRDRQLDRVRPLWESRQGAGVVWAVHEAARLGHLAALLFGETAGVCVAGASFVFFYNSVFLKSEKKKNE